MNNEFLVKMVKAEMLRYEAIKEILPECVKSNVDNMEKDFKDLVRQIAVEIIKENTAEEERNEKNAKKISVDFDD